jgi:hypothetical protein
LATEKRRRGGTAEAVNLPWRVRSAPLATLKDRAWGERRRRSRPLPFDVEALAPLATEKTELGSLYEAGEECSSSHLTPSPA